MNSKKRVSPGSLKTVSIMATVLLGGPLATLFMSAVAKKMFKTLGMHISLSWEEYRRRNSLAFANQTATMHGPPNIQGGQPVIADV